MKIKNYILILIFFLLNIKFTHGQMNVYHPFPDTNAIWIESSFSTDFSYNPPCVHYSSDTLFYSKDTLYGAYTYHSLLSSGSTSSSFCSGTNYYYNQFGGAIRQDTSQKRIYSASFSNSPDLLLYDFNLQIGDTLSTHWNQGNLNYVIDIDSVLVGNSYRKRFLLNQLGQTPHIDTSFALIEGIGGTYGLFAPLIPPFEQGSSLACFSGDGQNYPRGYNCSNTSSITSFNERKISVSISPNPCSSYTKLTTNQTDLKLTIYSLYGEPVRELKINSRQTLINCENLNSGIYFFQTIKDNTIIATDKLIIVNN